MKLRDTRRKPQGLSACFWAVPVALCLGMSAASAQSFPTRPIRIVVTYVPGGNTDVAARLVAPHLTADLGQQVIIDNRGGAGGVVGTEIVARAAPDGYTVLFGTSAGLSINPQLHAKLPYDVERDFSPISLLVINPQLMVAHPGLPAKNVGEFLKLARAQPGKINYASVGVGSPNHLGMELLKNMAGIDIVHVPYKGSAPAVLDLMSGTVSVFFSSIPVMLTHVKGGRLKALAVGSAARSPAAPDIPTVAESVPGFEYVTWYGLFVPFPHAAGGRFPLERGGGEVAQAAAARPAVARAGLRAPAHQPGGGPPVHEGRARAVVAGGQGHRFGGES